MPWKDGPPKIPCPRCGAPMYRRGDMCRECYRRRIPKKLCADCGAVLPRKTATLCRVCWMKRHMAKTSRPTCQDCAKPISWAVGYARAWRRPKRCMACEIERRHQRPRRLCSIPGCDQPHKAHGLCLRHWASGRQRERKPWSSARAYLAPLPCAICGYNRQLSALHRVDPKKGYEWGNVVQVCANCHGEIERGITPCPEPIPAPTVLPTTITV